MPRDPVRTPAQTCALCGCLGGGSGFAYKIEVPALRDPTAPRAVWHSSCYAQDDLARVMRAILRRRDAAAYHVRVVQVLRWIGRRGPGRVTRLA